MTTAKKAAKKAAPKKLTAEERLEKVEADLAGLKLYLKDHGIHVDGAADAEDESAEGDEPDEDDE